MIPSDHFTRFYNEVFKFLEKQGEEDLKKYWLEISKNQEKHTLELFKEKGLQGMYEYWDWTMFHHQISAPSWRH